MTAYPLLTPGEWAGYDGPIDAYPGYKTGSKFCQTVYAGHEWDILSAKRPWSLSQPDANSVRFEVRPGDMSAFDIAAQQSDRCELAASYDGMYQKPVGPGRVPMRTPVRVQFGWTLLPGPTNTAPWFVSGQLHLDDVAGVSPPVALALAPRSDKMMINIGATKAGKNSNWPLWTDTDPVVRGQRYLIEMRILLDPNGGQLQVYRDGVLITDYVGPLGYVGQRNAFWKIGLYRAHGCAETVAAIFDNLKFDWGWP